MLSWPSWLSPGSLRSAVLRRSRSTGPNAHQDSNRVLEGRISKPSSAKSKPLVDAAKLEAYAADKTKIKEESEDDTNSALEDTPASGSLMQPVRPEQRRRRTDEEESLADTEEKPKGSEYDTDRVTEFEYEEVTITLGTPAPSDSTTTRPLVKCEEEEEEEEKVRFDSETDTELDEESDGESESGDEKVSPWRREQLYLNTILNARNEFTLMPSTWRMHFRGIPLPDSLFYVQTKTRSIRPRIYARTDKLEYRGAVALRKLIEVHSRIQDIRSEEFAILKDKSLDRNMKNNLLETTSADIAKQLRRALETALAWANKDGAIDGYGSRLPPNVMVIELQGKQISEKSNSEEEIQKEMSCLAGQWRTYASSADEPSQPPVVFGFVIIKHIITVVTLDAADPEAMIHVPCRLHMAERNQHQWNALAIMVTVCWARDVLTDYADSRHNLQPETATDSSDPDA
ncbi:hypothetical protein F5Y17DRAFT_442092 [Xylariaceae sp. FL0594]|nr:hypothetical protein F5Y17DRAFT_442092 [Xylariaceae sp. FL0594]